MHPGVIRHSKGRWQLHGAGWRASYTLLSLSVTQHDKAQPLLSGVCINRQCLGVQGDAAGLKRLPLHACAVATAFTWAWSGTVKQCWQLHAPGWTASCLQ